ncbi:BTAD domain-containing putative transcriptional regulator [Thermomonospora cellulosilytica]|uniref:Putative ATPase/DNA-binding SARP family transcriptional activator n=1 Tax=Thermomonospora cellulosilytica TaxID=1411118 RepID=A0A7W3MWE1_9ACTN|nr:BTAD domain-containing putative transcriptional regulator [Thermomonospora cellulosilytica]MBA9003144.1 putative ATPase/DNA-binding SARP family transcriptional activator [Thermomonospora cellulosilytica]
MRFGVLGPLGVWTTDGRPVDVPGATVRALLADLLVHAGRPVSADRLAEDLWEGAPPGNPSGALHTKIWQLRRALERAEPGGRELVASRPPGYLLRVNADAVDAGRFTALADRARQTADPRERAALLADALALWRGAAYADFADRGFARAEITRLEERRLTVLEEWAEARLETGDHAALADELGALVAEHPLRERLHAAYMLALHRAGRRSRALEVYRELRERLRDELGLDPGREVAAVHEAVLREDTTPRPPPAPRRAGLPAPLTDLIGREDALERVDALLARGRLVTLTGPGGVGKTRLAVEVARRQGEAFPDGVHLVELGTLGASADRAALEEAVATVLGLRDAPGRTRPGGPGDRLVGALRARRSLLVLDNCEHVADTAAELAEFLLQYAPDLRILVTSQVPLGIPGEQVEVVAPLRVPAPDADPAAVAGSAAARLFTARAAAAAPGFALDAGNAAAVAAICRRLDGIPLALELAATRVRAMGVHELAHRLDDRFRLLDSGRRAAPPRQRTLRAMIDWSWEPLGDAERAVLRRLAVHADGCTLHAAERTCAGAPVAAGQVPGLLARLVDRSLVAVTDGADGPRYRLLETVAAYCTERLREAGELDRATARHLRHYTALAEEAEPQLRGHGQRRWLAVLDAETANLRAALDGAVRDGAADSALRLVNALAWYWILRGRLREAARSLDRALALDGPPGAAAEAAAWRAGVGLMTGEAVRLPPPYERRDGDPVRLARAHWFLGAALFNFGDRTAGERVATRALADFRALGDRWGEAAALWTLGWYALVRCDLAALRRDAERSHELFRALGDRWGQLQATDNLAELAEITGDYAQAARLHRDGLAIAEELGLWTDVPVKLAGLGRIALLTGDPARAAELYGRARRMAAEQSNRFWEIVAVAGLGAVARRRGDTDLAERHLREALDGYRRIGYEPGIAQTLADLGFLAERRGDVDEALALHLEGSAAARATGDPRAVALALEGLAGVRARAGDHAHAARLLGTAAATREAVGAPLPPAERSEVDRIAAAARRALGEEVFAAELARGRDTGPGEQLAAFTGAAAGGAPPPAAAEG